MAAPCEETGVWVLFRRSASQDQQGHLSPHHQEGTKAGEPLVSHSTPQHKTQHSPQAPFPWQVLSPCLLRSLFLPHCRLQDFHVSCSKDRREGDTSALPSPTPEPQQGWLLLHKGSCCTQHENTFSRTLT